MMKSDLLSADRLVPVSETLDSSSDVENLSHYFSVIKNMKRMCVHRRSRERHKNDAAYST